MSVTLKLNKLPHDRQAHTLPVRSAPNLFLYVLVWLHVFLVFSTHFSTIRHKKQQYRSALLSTDDCVKARKLLKHGEENIYNAK